MRWIRRAADGQRFVGNPDGTTENPAVCALPREQFPGCAERADLIQNIDWAYVRRALDEGHCVGIAVDLADTEAARQCAEMRVGHNVASRVMPDGTIYLCRPEAPGAGV